MGSSCGFLALEDLRPNLGLKKEDSCSVRFIEAFSGDLAFDSEKCQGRGTR